MWVGDMEESIDDKAWQKAKEYFDNLAKNPTLCFECEKNPLTRHALLCVECFDKRQGSS